MSRLMDLASPMVRLYATYMARRSRVWAQRYLDGEEPDYDGDETIRRFHFCNVWRELDRYSRWEIENIRGLPLWHQLDVIVVGRFTMVPASVAILLEGCGKDAFRRYREERRAAGLQWYNPALQMPRVKGDFVDTIVDHRDSYRRNRDACLRVLETAETAQEVAERIMPLVRFVGPFRSYEIATSLTYSEHLPHLHEEQLFNVGPGAKAGLELLTGRSKLDRATCEALRDEAKALLIRTDFRWIPAEWQGDQANLQPCKFTMRTVEDSLCEFRKYVVLGKHAEIEATATRRTYRRRDITL